MIASRPGRRLSGALSAVIVAALALSFLPATTNASTASDAESLIVDLVNAQRTARGLVPLRRYGDLADVAGRRAAKMRDANVLSHSVGGDLGKQLTNEGVTWYRYGETIAYSRSAWAKDAARSLVKMWMASTPHRDLLMSTRLNYIGVGLAYRSSNGRTYGSVVMTDSPDHTGAGAWHTGRKVTGGDDITWTWSGADVRLQTRTAGLRDFDVQYRIGTGTWRTIYNDMTAKSLTLWNRTRGTSYAVRVRATDQRGNIGAWTAESRVTLP